MVPTICETFGEAASGRASSGTLDQFFRHWEAMEGRRTGVPAWLRGAEIVATKKAHTDRWAVPFLPDALGRTGNGSTFVVELKYGSKFEPLALAEALHHAFELRNHAASFPGAIHRASPPTAVIISQWNAWLRSSVDALRTLGVSTAALRYIEVVALNVPGFRAPVLWFEEYLTRDALEPRKRGLPLALRTHDDAPKTRWYDRRDGSGVVVASEAALVAGCLPREVHRTSYAPLTSGGWLVCGGNELGGGTTEYSFKAPSKSVK